MTEIAWDGIGVSKKKFELIKLWFEERFGRKPEYDRVYFSEWVDRFRFLRDTELPWQMDQQSRQTWIRMATFHLW